MARRRRRRRATPGGGGGGGPRGGGGAAAAAHDLVVPRHALRVLCHGVVVGGLGARGAALDGRGGDHGGVGAADVGGATRGGDGGGRAVCAQQRAAVGQFGALGQAAGLEGRAKRAGREEQGQGCAGIAF
jgi:hypothetical protein